MLIVVVVMRDEQGEKKEPKSVSVWRIKRNLILKKGLIYVNQCFFLFKDRIVNNVFYLLEIQVVDVLYVKIQNEK